MSTHFLIFSSNRRTILVRWTLLAKITPLMVLLSIKLLLYGSTKKLCHLPLSSHLLCYPMQHIRTLTAFPEREGFLKRFAFLPMSATIYQNFLPLYAKLAFPVITLPNLVTDLTLATFLLKPQHMNIGCRFVLCVCYWPWLRKILPPAIRLAEKSIPNVPYAGTSMNRPFYFPYLLHRLTRAHSPLPCAMDK